MIRRTTRRAVLGAFAALALLAAAPTGALAGDEGLTRVSTKLPSGQEVHGWLAMPAKTPAPTVMVIHEWWGLTDYIKQVTRDLAAAGYVALAVDLYEGKVETTREGAKATMLGMDKARATETVVAWTDWMRKHRQGTGKVGTVGFCFGGGWSLRTGIATPVDATVVYYGYVKQPAESLKNLRGPVLGHFATQDKRINAEMVGAFENAMDTAGKTYTSHWYEAQHAFTNHDGTRYDKKASEASWARTVEFLGKTLK